MDYQIPKKVKSRLPKLVKPIIPLALPENEELEPLGYIDCTCHNTPGDSSSGKYIINIPGFVSGMTED